MNNKNNYQNIIIISTLIAIIISKIYPTDTAQLLGLVLTSIGDQLAILTLPTEATEEATASEKDCQLFR